MTVTWTMVDEIRLFRWVAELKPAGPNKHFHMMCIVERMNHPDRFPVTLLQKETVKLGKVFTASDIWSKLKEYYDLTLLDSLETREGRQQLVTSADEEVLDKKEFGLPWEEYGELILANATDGVDEKPKEQDIGLASPEETASSQRETSPESEGGLKAEEGSEEDEEEEEEEEEDDDDDRKQQGRRYSRTRRFSRRLQEESKKREKDGEASDNELPEEEVNETKEAPEKKRKPKSDQPLAKRTRHATAINSPEDNTVHKRRKTKTTTAPKATVATRLRHKNKSKNTK